MSWPPAYPADPQPETLFFCEQWRCSLRVKICIYRQTARERKRLKDKDGVVKRLPQKAIYPYCGSGNCQQGAKMTEAMSKFKLEPSTHELVLIQVSLPRERR